MLTFEKILEPEYYNRFQCVASTCPDTCCIGWDVAIDETTFNAYRQCSDEALKPMLDKYVITNDDTDYFRYALIKMGDYVCPFLTDGKLCFIQKTLDEKALSITCSRFPRVYNNVCGVLERSLDLSCPISAELVLLNENPMLFDSINTPIALGKMRIPFLVAENDLETKPYRYFHDIRSFVIEMLQNRTYPLWQRLIILSLFCSHLDKVPVPNYDADIPYLIAHFENKLQTGEFRKPMEDAESQLMTQLQAMKILIDHRLQGAYISEKFLAIVDEFKKGVGDNGSASYAVLTSRYAEAYTEYYQPFMENHGYILENYVVNYVFKNLFPFGQQNSIYSEQRSIYEEYMLLIIHYSLIKTFLIGIAGHHKDQLAIKHVVELIQSFSKAIEHNMPYLCQSIHFIKEANMNNTSGMAVFIKN